MSNSDYQQYLEKLHSGFNISDEVLNSTVQEAMGLSPVEKNKIQAGEANEVYDLTLPNGNHVIARISRYENSEFSKEAWAIGKAKAAGVPVPDMLIVKDIQIDGKNGQICIQSKIDGATLERGGIDYHTLDRQKLRGIINQAGRILSRIHSIPTDGFGDLDSQGRGKYKTFQELMEKHLESFDGFLEAAKKLRLDEGIFKAQYEILSRKAKTIPNISPILTHNDYGPKHFMIKDGKITGILDWGIMEGNSPVNDFAKWAFWYEEIPVEWLQEGYTNKQLFEGNFQDKLHWNMLNNSLDSFWWYYETGYSKGIEDVFDRIKEILKFYS